MHVSTYWSLRVVFFFQIDFFMWITIILSVVPIHVIIFKDAGKYSFYYQIRGLRYWRTIHFLQFLWNVLISLHRIYKFWKNFLLCPNDQSGNKSTKHTETYYCMRKITFPNIVCLFWSSGVCPIVMKNWLPLSFGPLLAIATNPLLTKRNRVWISS